MRCDNRRKKDRCFEKIVKSAALFSIAAAVSVAGFILLGALPALQKAGIQGLFSSKWQPKSGNYGITAMLVSSITAAFCSSSLAFMLTMFCAAWLLNFAPKIMLFAAKRVCSVMSGVPTAIFGLWGLVTVIPLMQRLFPDKTAQSGGASLLAAIVMLICLQLPFMLPKCLASLEYSGKRFDAASLALGAEISQTVFLSQLFHAREQLRAVFLAGIRLAFCETMAVQFVSGNIVSWPEIFGSVRLLGAGLMLEMGYAQAVHRSALFFIGFVMLAVALLTEFFSSKK